MLCKILKPLFPFKPAIHQAEIRIQIADPTVTIIVLFVPANNSRA
jgi:hypothetical protein